ncbi:unnamed protein product [Camellia sinensis]
MGRAPCCDKTKVKRGTWSPEEDITLKNYIEKFGTVSNWISLPQKAGLMRCGKSCRLRWLNYLRPNIKHGGFTEEEDNIILSLYHNMGSRWSVIASHLPGRTDNDVKNYWNTKLKKKLLLKNTTFKSTTKTKLNTYCHRNSDCSNTSTSGVLQHAMINANYQQNLVPEVMLSDPIQVPESGSPSTYICSSGGVSTSSQEVTSLSPFENKDGLWPGNGGGGAAQDDDGFLMGLVASGFYYDLLNDFDFEEKIG